MVRDVSGEGSVVHIVSPGLDVDRFVEPINDDPRPVENVIVYSPTESHAFPQAATDKLLERLGEAGPKPDHKRLSSDAFTAATKTVRQDLLRELAAGNSINLNVTSGYHQIGYICLIAAYFVVEERASASDGTADIHDRVTCYTSEPAEFHFAELLAQSAELRQERLDSKIQGLRTRTSNLEGRVERDRQTVQQIISLLELFDGHPGDTFDEHLQVMLETTTLADSEVDEVVEAMNQVFTGIDQIVSGANTIANLDDLEAGDENPMLQYFFDSVLGIEDLLGELPVEDDEEFEPIMLMKYFEQRLQEIEAILNRVGSGPESLLDELEEITTPADNRDGNVFDLIAEEGIAGGTRQFNGVPYQQIPGPIDLDLRETERALLLALASIDGKAGSLREFLDAVIVAAVEIQDCPGLENLDKSARNDLRSSIQRTVQYNLNRLEEKGLINREYGRETVITFSRAGDVYVNSGEMEVHWGETAFDNLDQSIER